MEAISREVRPARARSRYFGALAKWNYSRQDLVACYKPEMHAPNYPPVFVSNARAMNLSRWTDARESVGNFGGRFLNAAASSLLRVIVVFITQSD